jgi:hypothetical protein
MKEEKELNTDLKSYKNFFSQFSPSEQGAGLETLILGLRVNCNANVLLLLARNAKICRKNFDQHFD